MVILYLIMPGLPEDDDAIRGCVRGWKGDTAATGARGSGLARLSWRAVVPRKLARPAVV